MLKRGKRLPRVLLTAAIVLTLAACDPSPIERAERDEITRMSSEEPAMRKAFEQARSQLDDFLRLAASPEEGTSNYALKVAISDERNTEYFWVNLFTNNGDVFTGYLANEPRLVKRYKNGERFQFDRKQVVDWTYIDNRNNRMMGNFTACALLTKETPAQVEAFKQKYGLRCE
jgi:uncharacterized protein YegJ (DUF2314 family)